MSCFFLFVLPHIGCTTLKYASIKRYPFSCRQIGKKIQTDCLTGIVPDRFALLAHLKTSNAFTGTYWVAFALL